MTKLIKKSIIWTKQRTTHKVKEKIERYMWVLLLNRKQERRDKRQRDSIAFMCKGKIERTVEKQK